MCVIKRRNTNPVTEKKFKCESCGKLFSRKGDLKQHVRFVHEKIKQFSCPYCHNRFHTNASLTRHLATQSGVKNYKCSHCDYAVVRQKHLTVHINARHTNKTYMCRSDHPVHQYMCHTTKTAGLISVNTVKRDLEDLMF